MRAVIGCSRSTNGLSDEQLRRPLTQSEHDPENHWTALDHLAHMALVERNFNAMVRRTSPGSANPVGLLNDDEGQPRTRDEIMKIVHAQTEEWQVSPPRRFLQRGRGLDGRARVARRCS